jgi:hypothetical protein
VEDDTWAPHVGQGARSGGSARRITRPWGPASTWTMPCACRVPAGVTHLWHAGPQWQHTSGIRTSRNTLLHAQRKQVRITKLALLGVRVQKLAL